MLNWNGFCIVVQEVRFLEKPRMFQRMDHIGIVVNNIDDSLNTYCNQLGFTLLETGTDS